MKRISGITMMFVEEDVYSITLTPFSSNYSFGIRAYPQLIVESIEEAKGRRTNFDETESICGFLTYEDSDENLPTALDYNNVIILNFDATERMLISADDSVRLSLPDASELRSLGNSIHYIKKPQGDSSAFVIRKWNID